MNSTRLTVDGIEQNGSVRRKKNKKRARKMEKRAKKSISIYNLLAETRITIVELYEAERNDEN